MSDRVPQPWEVWHARFDFSEGHGYKYRPVIVLAIRSDGSLVAMVTGAANKLSLEHDYPIREWEAAGLEKPSIARLDRIAADDARRETDSSSNPRSDQLL